MNPRIILEDQVSITCSNEVVRADSDSGADVDVTSQPRFEVLATDSLRLIKLDQGNNDYEIVKKSFERKGINIVGIYKKNYDWSVVEHARLEVFRVFANAVATKNGGDANLKYGWYGGSRDEIREILSCGFRHFDGKSLSYGRGIYLSPANRPMECVKTSVADSDGLMHVLLCRVILGNSETIPFGSHKDQPSSLNFDSGVDNIPSPTKYVIWERFINTHILPMYMISFKVDKLTGARSLRTSTFPHLTITGLKKQLKHYLSPSKMLLVERLHHDFYQNKVSKSEFIRNLLKITGDDVIRAIVQGLR